MTPALARLIIYTRKIDQMAAFYGRHFGFETRHRDGDRIVELVPNGPGAVLLLHPAAKSQKQGQAQVKLVFDVEDVAAFCAASARRGLVFGKIHGADGYLFANAKDPSGNSIQVSSRAFASEPTRVDPHGPTGAKISNGPP